MLFRSGTFYDNYAWVAAIGEDGMSTPYTAGGSWGYCRHSLTGTVGIGTDGTAIGTYCYDYGANGNDLTGGIEKQTGRRGCRNSFR